MGVRWLFLGFRGVFSRCEADKKGVGVGTDWAVFVVRVLGLGGVCVGSVGVGTDSLLRQTKKVSALGDVLAEGVGLRSASLLRSEIGGKTKEKQLLRWMLRGC